MKTIGQKIMQIEGLLGTRDITPWQENFIRSIVQRTEGGKFTPRLSVKQVDTIERIYERHFV